jgi:Transcriptional regulator, AbiEi antitoxin
MRPLPASPVFTVDEAYAIGWTPAALHHACRRGRVRRIRRGVYTALPEVTPQLAAQAAACAARHGVVSHRSAALLHGLPLIGAHAPVPELTVPPRSSADLPGIHFYRARLRPQDTVTIGDTRVTSVPRTVADLARHRPVATAVAAIDAALHGQTATVEEIQDVLRFCWNWPGIRRAWRALRLSDGRAESPLESVSRLVIPKLGLPRPEPQKHIFDRYGRLCGRGDFYWDEYGVVGEADGRSKYDDRSVLTAEKDRQEDFEDLALVVVRWGWRHVTEQRDRLQVRLENGFERGRLRDRSGFPRLWTL